MKAFKFVTGLMLLPICAAATLTIASLIRTIQPDSAFPIPPPAIALGVGFLFWLFLYYVLPRPVRTYVLAHELTHALWGALMGASVSRIRISKDRGSVQLSKNNFLITLAPYFFPLYTVLCVLAYYAITVFFDVGDYHLFWLGVVGFTWGFHFTFTIGALLQHQTDIREHGWLFSYSVIYFMNAVGIALWIVMVSSATLEQLITLLQSRIVSVFGAMWVWVWGGIGRFLAELT